MKKLSNKQKLMLALLLLIFAAIKVVAIFWWQNNEGKTGSETQVVTCDVRVGCLLPNGAVLSFKGTVSPKVPFEIVLDHVTGASEAFISFEMVDMDMGFNRYKLTLNPLKNSQMKADKVRLPVCVSQRKDYLAILNLDGKRYQIAFKAV